MEKKEGTSVTEGGGETKVAGQLPKQNLEVRIFVWRFFREEKLIPLEERNVKIYFLNVDFAEESEIID